MARMIASYIMAYWGKAQPQGQFEWHPLSYHSLDVAAAMMALLETRPRLLSAIAQACELSLAETRLRLILVAALHDIGKFAPNFQMKVPELCAALRPGTFHSHDSRGHGQVGAGMWRRWSWPEPMNALESWHHAAASHHGVPVDAPLSVEDAIPHDDPSDADARAFAEAVFGLIGKPSGERPDAQTEVWRIAGLVMLADWIGSNQQWFPYTKPELALDAYWALAQKRAREALRNANLSETAAAHRFDLPDFLGSDAAASPLQRWSEAQQPGEGPHLYVVEDLTGAGKTEAALILAHRLMAAGAAEGLYWALPSMATANGLYARLKSRYRTLLAADAQSSLVLAHSARDLNDAFQASIQKSMDRHPPGMYGDAADAENISAEAACAAFIAEDRKKTFLAQIGVGTLDQALLAILPNRHQALRLAALSRRVLVIDEAHAYDAYQERMLRHLLAFHRELGGSAIVLSATLTRKQRLDLAKIYYPGRGCALKETNFPLTTHVNAHGVSETPQVSVRGTRRDLPVRRVDTPEVAMDALLANAREGACGVYVRNTVKDVLAAHAYLSARAGEGASVDIFHARFTLGDRLARENEVLQRFGRQSTPQERRGRILVASQVVEQSLDLCFDLMASDLCPMDLLIQRAGRLHRHDRPGRKPPELLVVGPPAADEVAANWYGAPFPVAQFVYPHTGQLWRTMRVLEAEGGLNLATGSPRSFIEPVFGADAIAHPETLNAAADRAEAVAQSDSGIARLNALKPGDFSPQAGAWGSDVMTPTRLGDPTITLRLARWSNGKLTPWIVAESDYRSWRLSEITVRAGRFAEAEPPDAAAATAIAAMQASWRLRFDPPPILAVTQGEEEGVWEGAWLDKNRKRLIAIYSASCGLIIS